MLGKIGKFNLNFNWGAGKNASSENRGGGYDDKILSRRGETDKFRDPFSFSAICFISSDRDFSSSIINMVAKSIPVS